MDDPFDFDFGDAGGAFGDLEDMFGEWAGGANRNSTGSATFFEGDNEAIASPEALRKAMARDVSEMQAAHDRNFERNQQRIDEFGNFLDEGLDEYRERSKVELQDPESYASVQRGEKALNEFEDLTAQNLSAAAQGIQGRFGKSISMVNAGRNPDGTLMTASQQAEQRQRLDGQINNATAQAMTPIVNQYNAQKAQMGFKVAGLTQAAERMEQQKKLFNAANEVKFASLELQGRGQMVQFQRANPESVVSLFGAMTSLTQAGMDLERFKDSQAWSMHMSGNTDTIDAQMDDLIEGHLNDEGEFG